VRLPAAGSRGRPIGTSARLAIGAWSVKRSVTLKDSAEKRTFKRPRELRP
jgi:hypothetical protein